MTDTINELRLAIKVASTQEGQALSCTQEWLEGILNSVEQLNARIIYYQDLTSDPTAEELHDENKRLRAEIATLRDILQVLTLKGTPT